jgi:hypothetical protein
MNKLYFQTLLVGSIIGLCSIFTPKIITAQTMNWQAFTGEQAHIISLQASFEDGFQLAVNYGYKLNTPLPILLNVGVALPAGEIALDDYKIRFGAQTEFLRLGDFATTFKAQGIVRHLSNPLGDYLSISSELGITAGVYRPTWFLAGEITYDKALFTNIRHSEQLKQIAFTPPQDGWYSSTGGNFLYGLQGGYSFTGLDLNARFGWVSTEDWKSTPFYLPLYLALGANVRF